MTRIIPSDAKYNELEVVNVRLVKEPAILSEKTINSSADAAELVEHFISQFDREVVCVLNIATDGTPICLNIASIGTLNTALVSPRDALKGTILSNACAFVLFHCHPSGNIKPSREDAMITQRFREAGVVLDIKMIDHVIVGCGNEKRFSFLENELMQADNIVDEYYRYFDDWER